MPREVEMKENVAALASELQSQAVDSRGQPAWSLEEFWPFDHLR